MRVLPSQGENSGNEHQDKEDSGASDGQKDDLIAIGCEEERSHSESTAIWTGSRIVDQDTESSKCTPGLLPVVCDNHHEPIRVPLPLLDLPVDVNGACDRVDSKNPVFIALGDAEC